MVRVVPPRDVGLHELKIIVTIATFLLPECVVE